MQEQEPVQLQTWLSDGFQNGLKIIVMLILVLTIDKYVIRDTYCTFVPNLKCTHFSLKNVGCWGKPER